MILAAERAGADAPPDGSRNFRDLGGYRTADGSIVRRGRVYRSGTLAGLTRAGRAQLAALGIRRLCDLRSTGERQAAPCDWHADAGMTYWSRDYPTSFAELRALLASDLPTPEAARAAMLGGYRDLPYTQAPAYAELFRSLAAVELPLVFNCSAGKDRAGLAAALVLAAIDVPPDTVRADYVLTDTVREHRAALAQAGRNVPHRDEGVVRAVYTADPAYLAAAFASIDARSGSLDGYLSDVLHVGPAERAAIRSHLLA